MWKFIVKRIVAMVPVLLGVTLVIYLIMSMAPGDPAKVILGEQATPEQIEELREQIRGSGIGTSATRAEILKKLIANQYIALNKKTQILTPTLLGEMIFDVVSVSIRSLLNPELTASWEKGLTYVAEGTITPEEYMNKLEHFIKSRTEAVLNNNHQYALKDFFDASARFYKKSAAK